jgi:hypothetical protein
MKSIKAMSKSLVIIILALLIGTMTFIIISNILNKLNN